MQGGCREAGPLPLLLCSKYGSVDHLTLFPLVAISAAKTWIVTFQIVV